MSTRTDNFNRTNGSSPGTPSDGGSAWSELIGGWAIDNPGGSAGTGYCWDGTSNAIMVLELSSADATVQAKMVGTANVGLCLRATDASNHLFLDLVDNTHAQLWSRVSGTYAQVGSTYAFGSAVLTGDTLRVDCSGTSITLYLNGTSLNSWTTSANSGGTKHGLWASSTGKMDDFSASSISGGGSATTFTLAAPSPADGQVNRPSGLFVVTPDASYTGTITLTPSGGGISTPVVLTWSASSAAQNCTFTPTSVGTVTVTPTNSGSLTNPAAVTYRSHIVEAIYPGLAAYDVAGSLLQLHQGNVVFNPSDGLYWAVGADMTGGNISGPNVTAVGVRSYSSSDLMNWTDHGLCLTPTVNSTTYDVVERPKLIRHPSNGKWYLAVHLDNYSYTTRLFALLSASTPAGPFNTVEIAPVKPGGVDSLDIGTLLDDDGTLYLYFSNPSTFQVVPLNGTWTGFGSVTTLTLSGLTSGPAESPALVKIAGMYFMIAANQTGWAANANQAYSSSSPTGPFTLLSYPYTSTGATGYATSYNGQSGAFLVTRANQIVYLGDRFNSGSLGDSTMIWLPTTVSSGDLVIPWVDSWTPTIPYSAPPSSARPRRQFRNRSLVRR